MRRVKKARGFGLIEVLLALVIVSVGAAALIKLQGTYIRSSGQTTVLEIAQQLADSKMEDLHTYEVIGTTSGKFAYQDIGNNVGGTMAAGNYTQGNTTFALSWTSTGLYWVSGAWTTTAPSPAPTYPDQKSLVVTVGWSDTRGVAQTVSVNGTAVPNLSSSSELLNSALVSNVEPQVTYTPGAAPDVIAVTINTSGTKQETSKPLPTVNQAGDSVEVQFETVTYDTNTKKQELKDQSTVSCNCSLASNVDALLPAFARSDSLSLIWNIGASETKQSGAPAAKQADNCTSCCRNHFDGASANFNSYYSQLIPGHGHYNTSNGTTFTQASSSGDDYLAACRFLRINGYYQPMPDWNLIGIAVMPADFLVDTTNQGYYKDYVEALVKYYVGLLIDNKSNPAALVNYTPPTSFNTYYALRTQSTLESTVEPGTYQLLARGVYVDFMSEEYLDSLLDEHNGSKTALLADADLLDKIPFNELNLTLLANWNSAAADKISVTNEAVQTVIDPANYYFGTYSRGRVNAIQDTNSASVNVTAVIRRSSSGIAVGKYAISSADDVSYSASYPVVVDNSQSPTPKIVLQGDIRCLDTKSTGKLVTSEPCKSNVVGGLSVIGSGGGAQCTVDTGGGQSTPYYTCEINKGSAVVLTFSHDDGNFNFNPSSISRSAADNTPADPDTQLIDIGCMLMARNTAPVDISLGCSAAN